MTFLVQHWLGNEGMPRRYVDYLPTDGFTVLNTISIDRRVRARGLDAPVHLERLQELPVRRVVTVDDPWGFGNSLEWATSCPPPRHNFTALPRIRSERPAFELHYPHLVERLRKEAHVGGHAAPSEIAAQADRPRGAAERRPEVALTAGAMTDGSGGGTSVLITVTGPDRPGVSSTLFAALTRHGVELLDVEQVVIRGRLTLGVLVATREDPEALQESVEQAMASISMQVHTSLEVDDDPGSRRHSTHVVVVLGRPITARGFSEVARAIAEIGVEHRRDPPAGRLPGHRARADGLAGPEGHDDLPAGCAAGRAMEVGRRAGVDIAVERAGLARRSKRLIVFDVDSTLIQGEVIEMLAARAGSGAEAEVRAVTEAAMRGELDFAESLQRRVATLAGLRRDGARPTSPRSCS